MAIFGNGNKVETQFKKIYKSRLTKTGMSELLREIDKEFSEYNHLTALSKAKVEDSIPDVKKWETKLDEAVESINKIFKKKIDWTPAETTFIEKLIKEIKEQAAALNQMLEKAQKAAKETSSSEETLLKAQAELVAKKFPSYEGKTKVALESIEKLEEYVKTQTRMVDELVKSSPNKEDVSFLKDRLEGLEKLLDRCEKSDVDTITSEMKRVLDPIYKMAKICIHNEKIKKLDASIRGKEQTVNDVVAKLKERLLMGKNKIWALNEKLEQSLDN